MYDLMAEAEDAFETEFDPLPEPVLSCLDAAQRGAGIIAQSWMIDLNEADVEPPPPPAERTQAFTLWLRSSDFHGHRQRGAEIVDRLLADNPFTTLQIVLEPTGGPRQLTVETYETLLRAAFQTPTYLDRFYSVQPGRIKGAKRLVISVSEAPDNQWRERIGEYATIVEQGTSSLAPHLSPLAKLPG